MFLVLRLSVRLIHRTDFQKDSECFTFSRIRRSLGEGGWRADRGEVELCK